MNLSFSIECPLLDDFLSHWSARYPSEDDDDYDRHIGKTLTNDSRDRLFKWKNRSTLSRAKTESVENNYPLIFPKSELEDRYLRSDKAGGAIWNIFYMHCIAPESWPIFDQHTYRAMRFMTTGAIFANDLNLTPKAKVYSIYKEQYIPFVATLNAEQRTIDKALFMFGQFLKLASKYCDQTFVVRDVI